MVEGSRRIFARLVTDTFNSIIARWYLVVAYVCMCMCREE